MTQPRVRARERNTVFDYIGNGRFPALDISAVPPVTTAQMREVDRMMIEVIGVGLVQMMENAGRTLATLAIARFAPLSVTVLAGSGNNGGGGLVAARHLINRGVAVTVVTAAEFRAGSLTQSQLRAAKACGVNLAHDPDGSDLVIDALVGYGLSGPLRGRTAKLASSAAEQESPVLALDNPTGLDATTGRAASGAIRAAATLTLALPETGLVGAPETGELYLADISVPTSVYETLGLRVPPLFAEGQLIRLLRSTDDAASTLQATNPDDQRRF
jgi:NAD(P)H-hydrate epimerase